MKNTVFLALAFAAAAVHAQKSYPSCLLADCVNFLTITVGCGYSDTSLDISPTQLTCICGSPSGPKEYQNCISCMNLDPANTVNYPTQCVVGIAPSSSASASASRAASSVSRSAVGASSATSVRSASGVSSAGQPAPQTPTPTPAPVPVPQTPTPAPAPTPTAPVTPAAIGGGLQAFGGCPNGDCSGGDSTKTNIYDVSKDSNAISGARGTAEAGRGAWYGTGAGMVVLAGLVWL